MRLGFQRGIRLLAGLVAFVAVLGASQSYAGVCDVPDDAHRINVRDFHTMGDGKSDDGPALRAALTAALGGSKPAVLEFESGKVYRITSFEEDFALRIVNAQNVTLLGNGAQLLLLPPHKIIRIDGSSDVSVCKLKIDYSPLPFTQGLVVASDPVGGTFDVEVESGFDVPAVDAEGVTDNSAVWRFAIPYQGAGRFEKRVQVKTVRAGQSARRIRIVPESAEDVGRMAPNQTHLVLAMPKMGQTGGFAFAIVKSDRVHFDSVSVYAIPQQSFFIADNVGPITFSHVEQRRPAGSNRVMTGWRGVFRAMDNRAPVSWDGCFVEGAFDDAFNLLAIYQLVVEKVGDKSWRLVDLGANDSPIYKPGDRLQAIDLSPKRTLLGEAKIALVTQSGKESVVVLENPLPLKVGERACMENRNLCGSRVINLDAANENSSIRNCEIDGSVRLRSKSTIENSKIDGVLQIAASPTREGPLPRDIVIRNSVLNGHIRVGADANVGRLVGENGDTSSWTGGERWARNITFQNDRILAVFRAEGASLNLVGNDISWPPGRKFQISNSGPVRIRNLSANGAAVAQPSDRVTTGAGMSASDVVIEK